MQYYKYTLTFAAYSLLGFDVFEEVGVLKMIFNSIICTQNTLTFKIAKHGEGKVGCVNPP